MLEVEDIHVNYGRLVAPARRLASMSTKARLSASSDRTAPASRPCSPPSRVGCHCNRERCVWRDRLLSGMVPEAISRLGVSLVPEGRHVFGTLSVAENLRIGTFQRRDRANVNKDFERILEHFPQLRERLNQPGGRLSGGEQQMLVIARALLTRPRLVLVDEPSLGLAPRIIDQVYEILIDLRRRDGLDVADQRTVLRPRAEIRRSHLRAARRPRPVARPQPPICATAKRS